jgi:dTDP-D-glucose 4,6-dehydratase
MLFEDPILVTGGAGFIGANFLNLSVPRFPGRKFINADKLTYAANLASLRSIDKLPGYSLERSTSRTASRSTRCLRAPSPGSWCTSPQRAMSTEASSRPGSS